jgi:hypothetical protein
MRKMSVAVACIAGVLSIQALLASPSTPIHFIYAKQGATYAQFQSDTDVCARHAKRPHYYPLGRGQWATNDRPSSTVFLNCMAQTGYTLDKNGWDTGVLWILPYRPAH